MPYLDFRLGGTLILGGPSLRTDVTARVTYGAQLACLADTTRIGADTAIDGILSWKLAC